MPVIIHADKCNGCHGSNNPPCIRMCPGDLLMKDSKTGKILMRDPAECWDCLPCVKVCPQEAIEFRLSYQLGFHTARLLPHIHDTRDFITWELIDTKGDIDKFTIRTKILPVELDEKVEGVAPVDFSI
ncbi:MAG: 4Fe-4S binding protein [Nitrospirae bacterium]|nr:4Fe-4S binding protein [Nitrospirota bacterium]